MDKYYIAIISAIVLTSVAQLILKKAALVSNKKSFSIFSYLNIYSVVSYALFVIVTLLNLYALKKIQVKEMVIFLPLTYLIIPIFSYLLFKEKIGKQHILGILVIITGIIIFNL